MVIYHIKIYDVSIKLRYIQYLFLFHFFFINSYIINRSIDPQITNKNIFTFLQDFFNCKEL